MDTFRSHLDTAASFSIVPTSRGGDKSTPTGEIYGQGIHGYVKQGYERVAL